MVENEALSLYFQSYQQGVYLPSLALATLYPEDVRTGEELKEVAKHFYTDDIPTVAHLHGAEVSSLQDWLRCRSGAHGPVLLQMIESHGENEMGESAAARLASAIPDKDCTEDARGILSKLVEEFPTWSTAHVKLGLLELEHGDMSVALRVLTTAVQCDPKNAEAWAALSTCALHQHQYPCAFISASQLAFLNPTSKLPADLFERINTAYEEALHPYQQIQNIAQRRNLF